MVKHQKLNLGSPRGHAWSNFHFWVQNTMGILTTKFHLYPIISSQVIHPISKVQNLFFWIKVIDTGPLFIISRKVPISGLRGSFGKCSQLPVQSPHLIQIMIQDVSCHYISSLQVSAPCAHCGPRNDSLKLGVGLLT